MELFFDTETSGFINKNLPADHSDQAWIMQLAFILSDKERIYTEFSTLITANGRSCHPGAQKIHQISVEDCDIGGISENRLFGIIAPSFFDPGDITLVAHNIFFDLGFLEQYMERNGYLSDSRVLKERDLFCTMKGSTNLCKLPGKFGRYKWPKLTELYRFLFNEDFEGAHDALADVRATRRCFYKLKEILLSPLF